MLVHQLRDWLTGQAAKEGSPKMVGANKILTVSYGTFSCTLEGFDEPFSTMKAIAEYFRDLAADDRYFGAVPPTPDAEMLHRIAEREIQRRVEAKISEHGVVLRQAEAEPAPVPVVAAPVVAAPVVAAPVVVAEPVAVAAAAPLAAEDLPAAVEEAEVVVAEAPVAKEVAAEEVAPEEAAIEEPAVEELAVEDLAVEEPVLMAEEAAPEPVAAADEDDSYEISLDAIMAAAAEPADGAADMAEDAPLDLALATEADAPAADSVAAKLARIRAVVEGVRNGSAVAYAEDEEASAGPVEPVAEDFGFDLDQSEDNAELIAAEAARAAERAPEAPVADAAYDETYEEPVVEASADMADLPVDLDDDSEDQADQDDLAMLDAPVEAPAEPMMAAAADLPVAEVSPEAEAEDEDSALLARLSQMAAMAELPPEAPAAVGETAIETEAPEALADTIPEAEAPDHPSFFQRARARVIRLGKSVHIGHAEPASAAEADEMADTVARNAVAEDAPEVEDAAAAADAALSDAAMGDGPADEEADHDLSRLMEEAKSKLEGAETRRRFAAISHLKAAVAATLADRKMQPGESAAEAAQAEEDTMDLYRDDLSRAVRPRRPTIEGSSVGQRPSADIRPAPLVLVSEQRVNRPEGDGQDSAVIRPRRVHAGNLAVFAEDDEDEAEEAADLSPESASSFAEFATRMGASTLTDLLEAAAVYTASVEGKAHFTRPHLLRKVEFVSSRGGDYNREDGLRSFGTLLRQGKIQKISRGQFTVTDSSRFMSEARRAN